MIDMSILAGLLASPNEQGRFYGVTVGLVTNNQDPDKLGRVKVRFPWLSDEEESHWARVLTPMAGNGRGLYFLPEVDDEVLVAFEHGLMEFPYVLGALWNGKDAPPETNDDGENNIRVIKSRSGHIIGLDDTDGEEKIEIIDQSGNNYITIETAKNTITITSAKDVVIEAKQGTLKLDAKNIEITSSAKTNLQAKGGLDLNGRPENTTIQGKEVHIN